MKYVVILTDGAADTPVDELGGKTPLEAAVKPNIDALARRAEVGMVKTVPEGYPPGSDVANLAVFGYDPEKYYTGRSPLEAESIGVPLELTDTTFRANVVTLSDEENYADKTMVDYSSDEITTEEAHKLIDAVNEKLSCDEYEFFGGTSYRHLLVWHNRKNDFSLTPPHDISGRKIGEYLPKNDVLLGLMEKSYEILKDHPVNLDRQRRGLHPANSVWIWGNGTKPDLDTYADKFGLHGTVISAVDLIKGIGRCAGLDIAEIEGATGTVNTNFDGKAEAAVNALSSGADFVYIHLEAADEAGHRHEIDNKVKSIELIDSKIVKPVLDYLKSSGEEYRILLMPDHPTPLNIMTHTSAPVPYILYKSDDEIDSGVETYNEKTAATTGKDAGMGCTLMNRMLS